MTDPLDALAEALQEHQHGSTAVGYCYEGHGEDTYAEATAIRAALRVEGFDVVPVAEVEALTPADKDFLARNALDEDCAVSLVEWAEARLTPAAPDTEEVRVDIEEGLRLLLVKARAFNDARRRVMRDRDRYRFQDHPEVLRAQDESIAAWAQARVDRIKAVLARDEGAPE